MNRGSRVRIEHLRTSGAAACSCGAIHRDSTRERVRQHVQQTGHTARYVVEDITGVCEVREHWCAQLGDESGTWLRIFHDRRFAESWIRRNNEGELVRYLHVTTPAEQVDTEEAA